MKKFKKIYEVPTADFFEIEAQCVLCASAGGGDTAAGPGGNGFQFGTNAGSW